MTTFKLPYVHEFRDGHIITHWKGWLLHRLRATAAGPSEHCGLNTVDRLPTPICQIPANAPTGRSYRPFLSNTGIGPSLE